VLRLALAGLMLSAAFSLAAPAGASAAFLFRFGGDTVILQDFEGADNHVTFGFSASGDHTFTDTGATIDTDSNFDGNLQNDSCAPVPRTSPTPTNSATCPAQAGDSVVLALGLGDDDAAPDATTSPAEYTICGGSGADNLTGGPGFDFIVGEDGPDTLAGEGGPDLLDGELHCF